MMIRNVLNKVFYLLWAAIMLSMAVACPSVSDGEDAGTDAGESAPGWESAFDASGAGSLSSVWGSGPEDVFVVGGDDDRGTAFHFDGSTWSSMMIPEGVPLLVWVYGFGPDDVFAVGVEGGMAHYDGTAWSPIETNLETDLWGIFGFSRDELWIVGGDTSSGSPLLMKYDADQETFETIELNADQNPNGAYSLFKVWGIGDRLFAVGQRGLILSYDSGNWAYQAAGALASEDFVSLWGNSTDHIVAVGGRANARIAVWDGSMWNTTAPSGLGGLNGVFMNDSGRVDVGGVNGYMGLYATESDSLTDVASGTRLCIHAVWGDNAGKTYAVGGSFIPGNHLGVAIVIEDE